MRNSGATSSPTAAIRVAWTFTVQRKLMQATPVETDGGHTYVLDEAKGARTYLAG